MREITVTKAEAGQRFDRFLSKYMPGAASGFLHKMLRKKNIKLNGKKAEGNEKVREGDTIQIFFSEDTFRKFTGEKESGAAPAGKGEKAGSVPPKKREENKLRSQVRLLYSSEDTLLFHKPAGMLTQKAAKEDDSLNDYLLDYCREKGIIRAGAPSGFRPSVANRLDRNTSGIVLCGITTAGLQRLALLLRNRNLEKYYLCIVQGVMKKDRKIKGYLKKDEERNVVTLLQRPEEGAEAVETWYQVLDTSSHATLLKVRLITGKSHQIRAHLASEGHPVLGDYKYGDRKANDALKRMTGISYQMLHSYELKMPGKNGIHIIDPPPEDFCRAMEACGLQLKDGSRSEKKQKVQRRGRRPSTGQKHPAGAEKMKNEPPAGRKNAAGAAGKQPAHPGRKNATGTAKKQLVHPGSKNTAGMAKKQPAQQSRKDRSRNRNGNMDIPGASGLRSRRNDKLHKSAIPG